MVRPEPSIATLEAVHAVSWVRLTSMTMVEAPAPLVPDYKGPCISNVVPQLIKAIMGRETASWVPSVIYGAQQVVLLVLDGLGWEQLQAKSALAPTIVDFVGGPIMSAAPTTTATCLTSIVTGRPPAMHGVLGYRLAVEGDVLDVLKWRTSSGDALETVDPHKFQTQPAFAANDVPAVTRRHHIGTGFSEAYLNVPRVIGYSVPSSLPLEIWKLAKAGEPLIYAYYDGIDTVAHAHGMGEHYDAELYTVDRLVRDVIAGLPKDTVVVITSDHGQVQVGRNVLDIDPEIVALCETFSGEGRFRWMHTKPELVETVKQMATERHGDVAWVLSKDEMIEQGWFGGPLDERFSSRIGDVALVSYERSAFRDPKHGGENNMQSRHGSLTSAEMYVPLIAHRV